MTIQNRPFQYGYRLVDGKLELGSKGPRGLFVRQITSMQPCGHWIETNGSLRAQHGKPGWLTVKLKKHRGIEYVSYPERRVERVYFDS